MLFLAASFREAQVPSIAASLVKYIAILPSMYVIFRHRKLVLGTFYLGATLNLAVMVANKGYMPVGGYEEYKDAAGALYIPMTESTRLNFLGDWILGAISPGDLVLVASFLVLAYACIKEVVEKKKLGKPLNSKEVK